MGDAAQQMAAFTFALPGIPLIYTGQEVGNTKRLEFFEKDIIQPSGGEYYTQFYKKLIAFKKDAKALQVPPYGGVLRELPHTASASVFAFTREVAGNRILALFNFSDQPVSFELTGSQAYGMYRDWKNDTLFTVTAGYIWEMEPHGFHLLTLK